MRQLHGGVESLSLDPGLVDQQPLQDAAQRRNIRRQAADQTGMSAGIAERAVAGVIIERSKFTHRDLVYRASHIEGRDTARVMTAI